MNPVLLFVSILLVILPSIKSQAGIGAGNTGVGSLNSATNMQPAPSVRPNGAGGAPNNPDMEAVQDPSRFRMSPFIGPPGGVATEPARRPGQAMSGDPLPARLLTERQKMINFYNEQMIAATLPKLCSVHPTMQNMKVIPMPNPTGNPPENRGSLGLTPPAGGPLLNRMQPVSPQAIPSSMAGNSNMQHPIMMDMMAMSSGSAVMDNSAMIKSNQMTKTQGAPMQESYPLMPVYVGMSGSSQAHVKLPVSGSVVGVKMSGTVTGSAASASAPALVTVYFFPYNNTRAVPFDD